MLGFGVYRVVRVRAHLMPPGYTEGSGGDTAGVSEMKGGGRRKSGGVKAEGAGRTGRAL